MGIGNLGFEIGDATVLEAEVGARGLEPFVEGAVVGRQLADPLFEGGVLGGDPLEGLLGPFGLQVAELAEEFAETDALGEDLGVGGLERTSRARASLSKPRPASAFSRPSIARAVGSKCWWR